jgi:hypothetical protein
MQSVRLSWSSCQLKHLLNSKWITSLPCRLDERTADDLHTIASFLVKVTFMQDFSFDQLLKISSV